MTSIPSSFILGASQKKRLRRALDRLAPSYNPAERMLRLPFSSPGYHTTLTGGWVHPTRESFTYAVALLDSDDKVEQDRGLDILDRLLDLQDTNPASKTYGIWSWFMDEPLDQMAPPDWNWADFCGAQLLETSLSHSHPYAMQERIKSAIIHAARSIERRNVDPGYTNIAIMGSFVALAAAETYEIADLYEYAMEKFRRFYAYTLEQGGFTEYNSPTYTIVALDELSRFHYVRNPEARSMAAELYRIAWKEFIDHFHAPTRQWAGPQSRAYKTLLPEQVGGLLHRATGGRYPFAEVEPEINEHRLPHVCPADMEARLFSLPTAREFRQTFIRKSNGLPSIVGTTHLAPEFTLGSVNIGDLWNQRRALLAYWGTRNAPSSLRLRLLHNGHDFTAANLFSVQRGGDVLAGIGYALDMGDSHPVFDYIKNSTIRTRDLRIRFQVEGEAASHLPPAPAELREPWIIVDGKFSLTVVFAQATWGDFQGHWESGHDTTAAWVDVVLYHGAEMEFCLADLRDTTSAFALRCSTGDSLIEAPTVRRERNQAHLSHGGLQLAFSAVPLPFNSLSCSFSSSIG